MTNIVACLLARGLYILTPAVSAPRVTCFYLPVPCAILVNLLERSIRLGELSHPHLPASDLIARTHRRPEIGSG